MTKIYLGQMCYKIITDNEILANHLWIHNWKLILSLMEKNRRNSSVANIQKNIVEIVSREKTISLSAIVNRFVDIELNEIQAAVFGLIHLGTLIAPLDEVELSNDIPLKLSNNV